MDDTNAAPGTGYYRNWISFGGLGLLLLGFVSGIFFFLLEILFDQSTPYMGILYMGCTGLIVAGFVLIPAGMAVERMRRKPGEKRGALSEFRFDLNIREHRYLALGFIATGMMVLVLVGIGSYKSYHATESVGFCGQLCHSVMNPEWVRYQDSAHARVKCAECHIGEGADWFVKSKLSGLRQVWAVTVNSFSRPIPTPIHDLRPARETCEHCHWRRQFIGFKELVRSYYLSDEQNSLHQLRMLVKIGGEKTTFLRGAGIHYHMLIASEVEYIAKDSRRQEIAWVRVTRGDGSVTEYNDTEDPLTDEQKASLEVRKMDCMDCHNRPAHQFPTPMERVNTALADGSISRDLPFIKVQAVSALDNDYPSTEEAMAGIESGLKDYYGSEYPEVLENGSEELTRSIQTVQRIYSETIFPEMKANWLAYPNNIGHRDSPGCFRCHNEEMQSAEGETIFTTCTGCHLILAQGESISDVNVNIEEGLRFVHPEDMEAIDEYTECFDCHTGGADIYE